MRIAIPLILGVAASIAACRADREPFDEGATLETPPAVEEAPATPLPPQPFPPAGAATDTTLPQLETDTGEVVTPPTQPPPGRN